MTITSFPVPTATATKADVGLANVDNTADLDKPVSTVQQAINASIGATASQALSTAQDVQSKAVVPTGLLFNIDTSVIVEMLPMTNTKLRFDNAAQAGATTLFISQFDGNNVSVGGLLQQVSVGQVARLESVTDRTKWLAFRVTSSISSGNSQKLGVTLLANGLTAFGNNDLVRVIFQPGATGAASATTLASATDFGTAALPTANAPLASALAGKVNTASVGAPSGVASLGSDGKVPAGQLPTSSGGTTTLVGATDYATAALASGNTSVATALAAKVSTSSVGAASGVASLGSDSKVPAGQLPTSVTTLAGATDYASAALATGNTSIATALAAKVATASVNAANGVAPLDGSSLVPLVNLPAGVKTIAGATDVASVALDTLNAPLAAALAAKIGTNAIDGNGGVAQIDANGILKPRYIGPAITSKRLNQLIAYNETQVSIAASRVSYEDSASFNESWANLSNFTTPGTPGVQVSGGLLYSTGTGTSASGANHALTNVSQNFRVVTTLNWVTATAGATGGVIIGFSKDTAGAVPTAAAGAAFGLYFNNAPSINQVTSVSSGLGTAGNIASSGALTGGTYVVTLIADSLYLSITARKTDGSAEFTYRILRSGFAVNNLYVFNSDGRALSGPSIGPIALRQNLPTLPMATAYPRTGVEGLGSTVIWTSDGTSDVMVRFPPGYDSRKPVPIVIMCHGNGSNVLSTFTDSNFKAAADAFVAQGWVVLAAAPNASTTTWGSQLGIGSYKRAYQYLRDNFMLGPVAVFARSMGGIESLNAISQGAIPAPVAWVGQSPTYSLQSCYTWATTNFKSVIDPAYGVTSYASIPAGFDPALMPQSAFGGIPMLILTATDDTVVDPAANGQAMATAVAPFCSVTSVTGITGNHTFTLSPYLTQITTFLAKYFKTTLVTGE